MSTIEDVKDSDVQWLYDLMKKDAEQAGYLINPDVEHTKNLVRGLFFNQTRYGYMSCPCRLGTGQRPRDMDIICPCDYRDQDLSQYGSCYCGLYVSNDIFSGKKAFAAIPERRPVSIVKRLVDAVVPEGTPGKGFSLKYPVWRCPVCGYLCARDEPPGVCPICKVEKSRFERFL